MRIGERPALRSRPRRPASSTRPAALVPLLVLAAALHALPSLAVVAPELQEPGSQPPETQPAGQATILPLLDSANCAGCHVSDFTPAGDEHSIARNWQGGMMANAARDPLMWAQLAVVQQDLAGTPVTDAGDTCLRCHAPKGWLEGRSAPANGSALLADDADGVNCHVCHLLTDPDGSGPIGEHTEPYLANDGAAQDPQGFYGSAMMVLHQRREDGSSATNSDEIARLGPYALTDANPVDDGPANPPHAAVQSAFHREPELCATCHDVSNPVVGDLSPTHGVQIFGVNPPPAFDGAIFDAGVRTTIDAKAAFNNPPYAYGVEQRTSSEHRASALFSTLVSEFATALPADLQVQGGALQIAHAQAQLAGQNGDHRDGTPRFFSCQSCHMPPVAARAGFLSVDVARTDLPKHDLTGANTWAPDAIAYLDGQNKLIVGGGLGSSHIEDLADAVLRARASLQSAASLGYTLGPTPGSLTVTVTNLTGHKLWTGYPDGRRMWLNVKWFDAQDQLLHEDCEYGTLGVQLDLDGDMNVPDEVQTLLDEECFATRVWKVESGISRAWAQRLVAASGAPDDGLDADPTLPLSYDRVTGAVVQTLGGFAADIEGSGVARSHHLILNDVVLGDNRIPPYGYDYSLALERNALPVPLTLFTSQGQGPEAGESYDHFDRVDVAPPQASNPVRAEVRLYYQPVSWEYVQFLWLANRGDTASGGDDFLQDAGNDLLEAWLATGMAAPEEMAFLSVPEPGAGLGGVVALVGLGALVRRQGGRDGRGV